MTKYLYFLHIVKRVLYTGFCPLTLCRKDDNLNFSVISGQHKNSLTQIIYQPNFLCSVYIYFFCNRTSKKFFLWRIFEHTKELTLLIPIEINIFKISKFLCLLLFFFNLKVVSVAAAYIHTQRIWKNNKSKTTIS